MKNPLQTAAKIALRKIVGIVVCQHSIDWIYF